MKKERSKRSQRRYNWLLIFSIILVVIMFISLAAVFINK